MKIFKDVWIVCLLLLCGSAIDAFANGNHATTGEESTHQITSTRPDSYGPLGVMGDHAHNAGEMMFSYRFMGMAMDGLQDGTGPISTEKALHDYAMVPFTMQMQMHMFGAMLAPHDRITLMGMTSYRRNFMEMEGAHFHASGGHDHAVGHQEMESAGLGDLRLSALIPLRNTSNTGLILTAGISIPTGSITIEGSHGGSQVTVLPYPMQLGSGSFEVRPGATFAATHGSWSYGLQARGAIPLNKNSQDYRLAPTIGSTLWGARRLNDWLSISLRGAFETWGNITTFTEHTETESNAHTDEHTGHDHDSHAAPEDTTAPAYMSPTMDPNLQGGTRGSLSAGMNLIFPDRLGGILAGQRFAVEFQMPVYQNLDGPQMPLAWTIIAGWQYTFEIW